MRKGVALPVIQKLMGHSNINTTMVYLTVTSDMMISEFNKDKGTKTCVKHRTNSVTNVCFYIGFDRLNGC